MIRIKVDGQEYKNVKKAFEDLGLPMNKHIKFRGELREEKQKVFEHEGVEHHFEVFDSNKAENSAG